MINVEKINELKKRMQQLNIKETDFEEKFILGSGKGGQKQNKSHSCVFLHHLPSHIQVKSQRSRSREDNRFFARRLLCDKIEDSLGLRKNLKKEKIRKQKKRRQRRQKKKSS